MPGATKSAISDASAADRRGVVPFLFGTVYAKTLRDSRVAVVGVGVVMAVLLLATAYAIADQFDTVERGVPWPARWRCCRPCSRA